MQMVIFESFHLFMIICDSWSTFFGVLQLFHQTFFKNDHENSETCQKEPSCAHPSASAPFNSVLLVITPVVSSACTPHPRFGLSVLKQALGLISHSIPQYIPPRDKSTTTSPKLTVTPHILFLVQFFLIAQELHFCNWFTRTRFPIRLTLYLVDVSIKSFHLQQLCLPPLSPRFLNLSPPCCRTPSILYLVDIWWQY